MIPSGWINSSSSLLGEGEGGRGERRRGEEEEDGQKDKEGTERGVILNLVDCITPNVPMSDLCLLDVLGKYLL